MEIFLDSGDAEQIKRYCSRYPSIITGVTTNPSIAAKQGGFNAAKFVCDLYVNTNVLSVSIELEPFKNKPGRSDASFNAEVDLLEKQAEDLAAEIEQLNEEALEILTIKVPCTPTGIAVCERLSRKGVDVNVTLVFTLGQAMLAAQAGAAFISPFIGRIDDHGLDGLELISRIVYAVSPHLAHTKVLAASIRNTDHVEACFEYGAQACTMTVDTFDALFHSTLTDQGLDKFCDDHRETLRIDYPQDFHTFKDQVDSQLEGAAPGHYVPQKVVWVDPPSGWRYGFPKKMPVSVQLGGAKACTQWLIDNGYPEGEAATWGNDGIPIRVWEVTEGE